MTPAKEARRLGLESLTIAMEMTGENRLYFEYMVKHKPLIFKAVIMGLVSEIESAPSNVVPFTGLTSLDIPVSRVLEAATEENLDSVVIIGYASDGDEYFASSVSDGGDVYWLLGRMKLKLLTTGDD